MQSSYVRHGTVNLEEFLPLIVVGANYKSKDNAVTLFGHSIRTCSLRLQTFAVRGTRCAACGIEGAFFAVEGLASGQNGFHANLYAMRDGKEVLMTMDHVIPTSANGRDHISNAQTLCSPCNHAKGGVQKAFEKKKECPA